MRVLYAGSTLLLLAYVGSRFVVGCSGPQRMKYLVLLVVIAVAVGIWRSRRAPDAAAPKAPPYRLPCRRYIQLRIPYCLNRLPCR